MDEFFEEDEPIEDVWTAFENGEKHLTNSALVPEEYQIRCIGDCKGAPTWPCDGRCGCDKNPLFCVVCRQCRGLGYDLRASIQNIIRIKDDEWIATNRYHAEGLEKIWDDHMQYCHAVIDAARAVVNDYDEALVVEHFQGFSSELYEEGPAHMESLRTTLDTLDKNVEDWTDPQ